MQIIKTFIKLIAFVLPVTVSAQSTYITQGSKEEHFIDRLEIKQQRNTDLNFSSLKPFNRKYIVQEAEFLDSARMGYLDSTGQDKRKDWVNLDLSPVDEYNMRSLLMNNSEWVTGPRDDFKSKMPWFKTFYTTKPNFFEVNTKDFFLAVNPVLQLSAGKETDNDKLVYLNSHGITLRGMIARKIGFSSTIVDNQERGPSYFQRLVNSSRAVPGVGFYKPFKNDNSQQDYFDGRGYITFNATKYIDVQFGYDKNFIGNGYRSLFLSNWGNSYLFLKLNTKIWKFNYQNIFMELNPQFVKNGDSLLDKKYAAMHHLSVNLTKWLNVGLFEGVIFGRKNRFDFQYLNPIIFYRHIEGTVGSPDNAVGGFDFKANILHRFQLYGQLLLDEFILKRIKNDPKNWANKYSIQVGAKYVDAFGVKNLDLQGEVNRVRPFTYTHSNIFGNYTHYNQPLAHPLGANFQEFIGIIKYQPLKKWYVNARLIYYYKGLDTTTTSENFGGDIFRSYNDTRKSESGYEIGSGNKMQVLNALLEISYEIRQNIFFELTLQQRNSKFVNYSTNPSLNSTLFTAGLRINMFKRVYDY
ncbi:MAG: capsule assembly Wzi family protein [Ferruginibacter sp.]